MGIKCVICLLGTDRRSIKDNDVIATHNYVIHLDQVNAIVHIWNGFRKSI